MTIWLLIMMLHGEPYIIDHYSTLEACQRHIKRGLECVEGTKLMLRVHGIEVNGV